jgi:RNase P/RNase MRP subunit p30
MAQISEIDVIGTDYTGEISIDNIIYRINRKPAELTSYPYLVVCKKIEEISVSTTDILVVDDFKRIEDGLKRRVRKRIGLEVTVSRARKQDGPNIGKWFKQIRNLYKFCKLNDYQFILSSGANSELEMVSGRSFDSILKICDIKPEQYWWDLAEWIETKFQRMVFVNA